MKKTLLLILVMSVLLSSASLAAAAPVVSITNPIDLQEFNYIPISVEGTVDGTKIQLVEAYVYDEGGWEVGYQELSFQKSGPDYDFWGSVELVAGWNTVKVFGWDKFSQFGVDLVEVCYDDPFTPNDECLA